MHVVWQAFGYTEEPLFPGTTAATAVIYCCPNFSTHLSAIFAGQFVDCKQVVVLIHLYVSWLSIETHLKNSFQRDFITLTTCN